MARLLRCASLMVIALATVPNTRTSATARSRPEIKNSTAKTNTKDRKMTQEERESVPLPRSRPTREPAVPPPSPPSRDQACLDRLAKAGIEFQIATLAPPPNPACVVDTPVRVKAIENASNTHIRIDGELVIACRFAKPLAYWLGEVAAPVFAASLGANLRAVHISGYECRNRNHADGGKLSAHALGIAADILSFELANGKMLGIKPDGATAAVRGAIDVVRKAGCGSFTTVLGPGSDTAHADHLHVDILRHGSSDQYRICQ
jgi:hypothetical protein